MRTIQIDDSTQKGKALIEYLQTLDFVKVEDEAYLVTDKQLELLHERREKRMNGEFRTFTWDEIKESAVKAKHEK